MEFSYKQRAQSLREMADHGVDVLVIGGGITGAGIALDAAARGFRTGLVEKADFASGTSSKSTKLVHGGLRYLAQLDFPLVREAVIERGLLLRNAPFLVQPLGFVLPIYADNRKPLGMPFALPSSSAISVALRLGLTLYDALAGKSGIQRHRHLGVEQALELIPTLKREGLRDAFIYYDAQTDDTLLTVTVLRTAASKGALIANYAEVTGFEEEHGKLTQAVIRDALSNEVFKVRADTIINATGVFSNRIEILAGEESKIHIEPAKGIHLTLPRSALNIGREAVILPETEDGRVLFIIPWGSCVTVGTTDTVGGDIDHPIATDDDIAYLLRHVNRTMSVSLTELDIISAWAGYRPLISHVQAGKPTSKLSRTHVIQDYPNGLITIAGGKLTTYRRMAQDVMDHVCKRLGKPVKHVTEHLPLLGSEGWREASATLRTSTALNPDSMSRLEKYGSEALKILDLIAAEPALAASIVAGLPYILAEVVYACRYQMAMRAEDIIERRVHLSFEDREHGAGALSQISDIIARENHVQGQK